MSISPETAYIALGANLDDPAAYVEAGIAALAGLPETRLVARSSLYRTAPGAAAPNRTTSTRSPA